MDYEAYKALYLHIPFCVQKCSYCDFESAATSREDNCIDEYLDSLILDIRRASREGSLGAIQTVYIGGGTPTHIGHARLSKLLYTLSLSMHLEPEVECTIEANPESVDEATIRDIWALGVNRISMGVQSFDDAVLKILGRPHDSALAKQAVRIAQTRFENISIDLMCGIPGQSIESFASSVAAAIELGVKHISVYPLTIENGTPFTTCVENGLMEYPDDDTAALHMQKAAELLEAAGYERYEVASYAKPGFQSRHNTAYWTGIPYLGLGKGATSMRQTPEFRERVKDGVVEERLSADEIIAEDLMLKMRMSRGISLEDVQAASFVFDKLPTLIGDLMAQGLISLHEERYRPTERGWLCGNQLYAGFLDLCE